jgi:ATP-binding cassette subfamily B protein
MLTVLAGPYLYKITIDFFINNTPTPDGKWLADIILGLASNFSGNSVPEISSILLVTALLYVSISLVQWIVTTTQLYYIEKLGLYVIADIRTDYFDHLNSLSQRFFEYGNTGHLISRITNDAESLKKLLSTGVIGLIGDLLMAVSLVVIMAMLNLQLTMISLLIAPILVIVSRVFQNWVKDAWRTARRNVAVLTGKVQDLMYGVKVTKSLTQEERSLAEFDEVNEQNMRVQIRAETVSVAFSSVVTVLSSIMTAAIWFLGGQNVITAARTLGELIAFSEYSTHFFSPIQSLAMLYGEIQSALAGAERIFIILDQTPEIEEPENPREIDDVKGEIEFKEVHFSYLKDQPVLRDVNFRTAPGEKLAIFGPTGSGKSTIINLLGRFYDPVEGSILIDGVDVRELSFETLRKTVAIVLQEPYLFSGTIEYNLKFGNPEVSDAEMVRVTKLVGIYDAIARLENGYATIILEGGANLSFGQRQLICLARAIIANPRILVFDEATSSVDPYTEANIQETLKQEMENRTVILVTHRVSTVRDSDRIIILDDGQIQNEGTHEQLLQNNELYRKLSEMQLVYVKK